MGVVWYQQQTDMNGSYAFIWHTVQMSFGLGSHPTPHSGGGCSSPSICWHTANHNLSWLLANVHLHYKPDDNSTAILIWVCQFVWISTAMTSWYNDNTFATVHLKESISYPNWTIYWIDNPQILTKGSELPGKNGSSIVEVCWKQLLTLQLIRY